MREKTTKNKSTYDVPAFTQQEVKKEGKVYTPDLISQDIIVRFPYFCVPSRSLCDPSMGQGNFLRVIYEQRLKETSSPNDAFEPLWGFELDSAAVSKAQEYFINRGVSKSLAKRNLLQGNSLELYQEYIEQFDDVIGNPPYVRAFKDYPYHIILRDNLADAFFQVGMELLKPGNDHHLVYITQDSFITNESSSLRRYLCRYNIKTVEHNFEYSKAFRAHDIAVDIGLIEVAKGEQQQTVNVQKHIPFSLPASAFSDDKWLIYPKPLIDLATQFQETGVPLSSQCRVKKGRTSNNHNGVPSSYGRHSYSKKQDTTYSVPVLGEPNTDFFFPKSLDPVIFATATDKRSDEPFAPFIMLPYFTSKFRFCLVEEDLLTTPLVYTLSGDNVKALLPLLNCSVVDYMIRYHTKSRDTGYEFKSSTFDAIRVPVIDDKNRPKLEALTEMVRRGEITQQECDQHVCATYYGIGDDVMDLIREAQQFWFKKNVRTLLKDQAFKERMFDRCAT